MYDLEQANEDHMWDQIDKIRNPTPFEKARRNEQMDTLDRLQNVRVNLQTLVTNWGKEAAHEEEFGDFEIASRTRRHIRQIKKVLAGKAPDDLTTGEKE